MTLKKSFEACANTGDSHRRSPYGIAIRALSDLRMYINVARGGYDVAKLGPELLELYPDTSSEERLKEAKELENFAASEEASGYPYLFSLACIRLWSILETLVHDICVGLLTEPTARGMPAVRKLKGPLIEFSGLSPEEQGESITILLDDATHASLKKGIGRFEALLEALGMTGGVPDVVRRLLFELSSSRNLIAHRNSVVDLSFKESCPWVELEVGARLVVDHVKFYRFFEASRWYLLEIVRRQEAVYPCDQPEYAGTMRRVALIQRNILEALEGGISAVHGNV